jgi:two-component SAPR family response regulator
VEFAILGPLQVRDSAARPVTVRRHKARVLLALLLCRRNRPVAANTLADWMWTGDRPPSARANLQSYASDVRRTLRAAGIPDCLHTTATGYLLQVRTEQVDAELFDDLAAAGQQALWSDAPTLAVEKLTRALGLWRGTPLEDIQVPAALQPDLALLAARRLEAISDCAAARLSVGQHPLATGESAGWRG